MPSGMMEPGYAALVNYCYITAVWKVILLCWMTGSQCRSLFDPVMSQTPVFCKTTFCPVVLITYYCNHTVTVVQSAVNKGVYPCFHCLPIWPDQTLGLQAADQLW